MTSSSENIFRVTDHLCGEIPGEFSSQRPVPRSFDVFFDLRLNKRLSKQLWGWWFETPSSSLWRRCNGWWKQSIPENGVYIMAADVYALGLCVFVEINFPTHCGLATHKNKCQWMAWGFISTKPLPKSIPIHCHLWISPLEMNLSEVDYLNYKVSFHEGIFEITSENMGHFVTPQYVIYVINCHFGQIKFRESFWFILFPPETHSRSYNAKETMNETWLTIICNEHCTCCWPRTCRCWAINSPLF